MAPRVTTIAIYVLAATDTSNVFPGLSEQPATILIRAHARGKFPDLSLHLTITLVLAYWKHKNAPRSLNFLDWELHRSLRVHSQLYYQIY
jgi:hypothetical protein